MVILDTDHISLIERGTSEPARRILERLHGLGEEDVAVTIVSFEEQTRGWLAYMAKAKSVARQIAAYERLGRHVETYSGIRVLPFDDAAAVHFQRLRRQLPRLGVMDLRTGAIAVARGATVLTRNVVDFRQIPGLAVEDRSA